jgi:hypothetical protein
MSARSSSSLTEESTPSQPCSSTTKTAFRTKELLDLFDCLGEVVDVMERATGHDCVEGLREDELLE